MKILSEDEFKKKYGETAVSYFDSPEKAPQWFSFDDAKDVFTKAGDDVALAMRSNPANPSAGAGTAIIQGGLSPFRAVGAGFFGSEQGQDVSESIVNTLSSVGDVITPDRVKEVVGEIAMNTIEGYQGMSPEEQLKQRNRLGVAEILSYFIGGNTVQNVAKNASIPDVPTQPIKNTAEEAVAQARNLKESVRALAGKSSVEDQFVSSATRLIDEPVGDQYLQGTALRTDNIVDVYDDYLSSAQKAINDIKADPPISTIGERIGNAFDDVIEQRRVVGQVKGDELKAVGNLKVGIDDPVQKLLVELANSGLSYNPRTKQLVSFQGTKFTVEEIAMLQQFVSRINLLGRSPTVRAIDDFIAKTRSSLAFTKGSTGVHTPTNAERIIDSGLAGLRNSLDPDVNGIQQLSRLSQANKTYGDLSDFIKEGGGYLGRVTQAGDYAKDASIAKSSVQSILNNGKKDWLLRLEELTGYNALDDAVVALQAMKDAGDFRGLSLLQKVKDGGLPATKAGVVGKIADFAVDKTKRAVLGEPSVQTRAYLKSLAKNSTKKVDLKVSDKAIKANAKLPRTKKLTAIEKKIDANVKAQKKAIKAGDFELVRKLKKAYIKLTIALKREIQWIKDNVKSQSGKADFFANRGKVNNLHPEDVSVMEDFITSARLKEMPSKKIDEMAYKLMERWDINVDQDANRIAQIFEDILVGKKKVKATNKTGREFSPKSKSATTKTTDLLEDIWKQANK